ncbi:MAG: High-affinity branched-chain amino acid transport system permease protein LivH [Acidimicrobiales bacterium]|nr:High-affinity branched-chain amino acid transport system permease protein LivH [Acidimicrobiales bacterium]
MASSPSLPLLRPLLRRLLALLAVLAIGLLGSAAPAMAQGTPSASAPTVCRTTRIDATKAHGKPLDKTIWGRLCQVRDGKAAYPKGVRVTVSQGAKLVGTVTTAADGLFVVAIPGNGTYQVRIDVKTLPKGFSLTDDREAVHRGVEVALGDQQVAFRLGADTRGKRTLSDDLSTIAKGVKLGLILAVAAVGLSLVFGVTGLVNFAHAELVTFGALAAYAANQGLGWPFLLAAPVGVIAGAAFGWLNEKVVWRPLRRRRLANLSMMVVSIGLSIAIRDVMQIVATPNPLNYDAGGVKREVKIGPVGLPPNDWYICLVCIVVLAAMVFLLKRTRLGMAIRAVADNPDLAASSGIAVDDIIGKVWIICGALAALGGILYGLSFKVQFDMGFVVLLSLFAAVVLGGLGSAYGAILGALVVGTIQETSGLFLDTDYKFVVALSVLILVLLFRPHGILGSRERFG